MKKSEFVELLVGLRSRDRRESESLAADVMMMARTINDLLSSAAGEVCRARLLPTTVAGSVQCGMVMSEATLDRFTLEIPAGDDQTLQVEIDPVMGAKPRFDLRCRLASGDIRQARIENVVTGKWELVWNDDRTAVDFSDEEFYRVIAWLVGGSDDQVPSGRHARNTPRGP